MLNALTYSWQGLKVTFVHEAAFRQELLVALILIPLAFYIGESVFETAILIFSVLLLLVVELINSAIEAVVDRVGEEQHPLAGRAKDMGSAAVFLTIIAISILWTMLIFM